MADNISVKDGSGSLITVASDDISGVQYTRHKITFGVDGASVDVSASNPLPVTPGNLTVTGGTIASNAADSGNPLKIGGVYNSSLPTFDAGDRADIQVNSRGAIYTELQNNGNVASNAADSGNPIKVGGVFNTTPATLDSGDRGDLQLTSTGSLRVEHTAVANNAADSGNPIKVGGVYNSSPPTLDSGDRGDLQVTSTGALRVDSSPAIANGAADSGNPLKVGGVYNLSPTTLDSGDRGDLQLTSNGSLKVDFAPSVAAGATDSGNPIKVGGIYTATLPTLDDGDRGNLQLNDKGALKVDLQTRLDSVNDSISAVQSGTWNIGTVSTVSAVTAVTTVTTVTTVSTVTAVTTVTTVSTVTTLTGSAIAHDAVDSGNPHKIGAKASASLSGGTMVAAGDRTDLFSGVDGVLITRPHANLEDIVSGVATITDGSSTSVIASAGAGIKIYITDIVICNTSSTEVTVDLRDGTGGSVKITVPAPANNGGFAKSFAVPIPFSAATAVAADPSGAASSIIVTLIGFKSKV